MFRVGEASLKVFVHPTHQFSHLHAGVYCRQPIGDAAMHLSSTDDHPEQCGTS